MPAPSKPGSAAEPKLTAKQKKLLEQKKKEEEERLRKEEEEKRLKEEEEERKRLEEEQRKLEEERRIKAEEERKRIDEERANFEISVVPKLRSTLEELWKPVKEEDEWNRFITCENLPKIEDGVDMNNYISFWLESIEGEKDKERRNFKQDLHLITDGMRTLKEMEYHILESASNGNQKMQEHYHNYFKQVSKCITTTLDDASDHIMQFYDIYRNCDNDQFTIINPNVKYGIWTNVSKKL